MRRGTRVGQAYVAVTADGDGINEEIVKSVDEAGPGVEKAADDHGKRYGNHFSDGFLDRIRDKMPEGLKKHFAKTADESGALFANNFFSKFKNSNAGKQAGQALGASLSDSLKQRLSEVDDEIKQILSTQATPGNSAFKTLVKDLRDAKKEASSLRGLLKDVSGNAAVGAARARKRNEPDLGDTVGRLFGDSSRNNFLNLFGKSIGGITRGIEGLFGVLAKGGRVFSLFGEGMAEAGQSASFLQKMLGGFSKVGVGAGSAVAEGFGSIIASGPGAVIAIIAVTAALSIMATVAGALVGILTALAATITAALTGALLVAGGAVAALAVAGGLLTAAFMSMTDAQRGLLNDAFRPLKAEMVGIGQIMLQQMVPAFQIWSANLQQALMLAVPVAQVLGQAFARAGANLTAALSGPGFQIFAQMMTAYLPTIVNNMTIALGNFMNGLLGVFAAITPFVAQFAGYLADVTARFSAWATSAQGQNAITSFVERALVSLQALWNAVTAFGGFLSAVLFSPQAMNAGNSMFDSIAAAFRRFTLGVQRAAANGDLKRWFNDAVKFGSALWSVIVGLYKVFVSLYNSGVLTGIAKALQYVAWSMQATAIMLNPLVSGFGSALVLSLQVVMHPLAALSAAIVAVGESIKWVLNLVGIAQKADFSKVGQAWNQGVGSNGASVLAGGNFSSGDDHRGGAGGSPSLSLPSIPKMPSINMGALQQSGTNALNNTSVDHGGYKPKGQWKNPYVAYANSLMSQNDSTRETIKKALISVNKAVVAGIKDAVKDKSGAKALIEAMNSQYAALHAGGDQAVSTARSALDSAAQSLASASSKRAAKQALKEVHRAQADLQNALNRQARINQVAQVLTKQRVVNKGHVDRMVAGLKTTNVTLAEFAAARAIIATKLEAANQKLADAVSLRDSYKQQITDSIKAYAGLATTQAQTIDGVEQALTASDISSNLQTKLAAIQKFQSDLKLLVAQGLSNDAYKQIVDAGVDDGTVLADALLAGGATAIQTTNTLVGQINSTAAALGVQTSSRMYQAGVDAAKGLVDGLTSQSKQLDAAATSLGNRIAAAVTKALGIHSPSTVMRDMMDPVGDGAVVGLYNQHGKVGAAAAALANLIGVNPGGPSANGGPTVSGNQKVGDVSLTVNTPTEDPVAVAHEAINELVGRL